MEPSRSWFDAVTAPSPSPAVPRATFRCRHGATIRPIAGEDLALLGGGTLRRTRRRVVRLAKAWSKWKTGELANALFEYLEMFHNCRRRHGALGMLTPIEYEMLHESQSVA